MAFDAQASGHNLHNADGTTGRVEAQRTASVVLCTEDKAVLDAIAAKLDISVSDLAAALESITVSVSTLMGVKNIAGAQIDPATETTLTLIAGKDFSTETTLAAMNAKFNTLGQKTMAASMPVVLASDHAALPVSGPLTDTQLRSAPVPTKDFAAGTEGDPYAGKIMCIGGPNDAGVLRPYFSTQYGGYRRLATVAADVIAYDTDEGRAFMVSVEKNFQIGSVETPLMLIRNPVASGIVMRIKQLIIDNVNNTGRTRLRFYESPTVTSPGTLLPSINAHLDVAVPAAACLIYLDPVVSANGTRFMGLSIDNSGNSMQVFIDLGLAIAAGYDILVTGTPDGTNRQAGLDFSWVETI